VQIAFTAADGSGFRVDRVPTDYPPDPQDMFIYYSALETWKSTPGTHLVPGADEDAGSMTSEVIRPVNFPFATEVALSFPGGIAQEHAPVGSLPLPSTAVGNPVVRLPNRIDGLRLSWNGPRYDGDGVVISEDGPQATCLKYFWPRARSPRTPPRAWPPPTTSTMRARSTPVPGTPPTATSGSSGPCPMRRPRAIPTP